MNWEQGATNQRRREAFFKGGPEPLEKEINEILGSKREDRLSDPFFELVQNTTLVRFSYLLRLCNFDGCDTVLLQVRTIITTRFTTNPIFFFVVLCVWTRSAHLSALSILFYKHLFLDTWIIFQTQTHMCAQRCVEACQPCVWTTLHTHTQAHTAVAHNLWYHVEGWWKWISIQIQSSLWSQDLFFMKSLASWIWCRRQFHQGNVSQCCRKSETPTTASLRIQKTWILLC